MTQQQQAQDATQSPGQRFAPVVGTIDVDAIDRVAEQRSQPSVLELVARDYRSARDAGDAELLDAVHRLEARLARLLEHGFRPVPTSIDEAIEQLFDAEAMYAGAEHDAAVRRSAKFDAQVARDRAEAATIVRLVGAGGKRGELPVPGAMSPTEAKDRLEEDPEYSALATAFRDRARESDEAERTLRIAGSRVETLRACVNAMARRSPLTPVPKVH